MPRCQLKRIIMLAELQNYCSADYSILGQFIADTKLFPENIILFLVVLQERCSMSKDMLHYYCH